MTKRTIKYAYSATPHHVQEADIPDEEEMNSLPTDDLIRIRNQLRSILRQLGIDIEHIDAELAKRVK